MKASLREDPRNTAIIYSLRRASIFDGLPEEDLAQVAGYASLRSLAKGEYLFRENDPACGFYVVRRGIINVHRVSADGREQVIHLFRVGESLAEAALAGDRGYPADARAVVTSEVIFIPKKEFFDHQRARNDLAWRMLSSLSVHLRSLVSSLESLKLKDAETRFLHWILRRCPQPPDSVSITIEIGMSKAALAGELGARQETLSRIFARLRDAGQIAIQGTSLVIRDPSALHRLFENNVGGKSH
jgi:CRP-like cAMP-binding protein